jgi:hypothetical protein
MPNFDLAVMRFRRIDLNFGHSDFDLGFNLIGITVSLRIFRELVEL